MPVINGNTGNNKNPVTVNNIFKMKVNRRGKKKFLEKCYLINMENNMSTTPIYNS